MPHQHVNHPHDAIDAVNSGNITNSFASSGGDILPVNTILVVRFSDGKWRTFVKVSMSSSLRWLPLSHVYGGSSGNNGGGHGTVSVQAEYNGCNNNSKEFLITYNQVSGPTILNLMVQKSFNNSYWSDLFLSETACTPSQFGQTTYVRVFGVTAEGNTDYATVTVYGGHDCGGEEAW